MAAFKDEIGPASLERLGAALADADGRFDGAAFVADALDGLEPLELKARVSHVARTLGCHLRGPFPESARVVVEAVEAGGLDGWAAWPTVTWVELHGRDHPAEALAALARLTSHASAEFAVRPFVDDDPGATMAVLRRWAGDPDEHVRRLVSEGTRPRLPWAPRLRTVDEDPTWAVPLLEALRDDPAPYVRRSVGNHLNDLSRVDRDLALEVARRWSDGRSDDVVRRGLRSLVKAGDPDALRLMGVDPDVEVELVELAGSPAVIELGGSLALRAVLRPTVQRPTALVLDYGVHHLRADGRHGRKVFKLRTVTAEPGAEVIVEWTHAVVPVTVRRYRSGPHRIDLQCNGQVLGTVAFELVVPGPDSPGPATSGLR